MITESKSGREAWRPPAFIDATGDGDLAALAGCGFEFDEAEGCPCQRMSLNALLVCEDAAQLGDLVRIAEPPPSIGHTRRKRIIFLGGDRADRTFPLVEQANPLRGA
jgi:hypothetical protein